MALREEWIGKVGQEWARRADALEFLLGPVGVEGLEALDIGPGARVLDIGSGAGASTAALLEIVGAQGRVTAIDISPDLVEQSRARLAGRENVTIIEGDASTHPFEAGAYDALFSRFGVMFFDDPPAAFANIRSAMRPDAPAVFVCFADAGRNQWASVPMSFVTEVMTQPGGPQGAGPGPAPGPGPFVWADPEVFHKALEAGGFRDVSESAFEFMAEIGDGDDPDPVVRAADFMMRVGPFATRLAGASDAAKAEARAFLERRLARHVRDGAVRLLASAWIIRARA